MLNSFDVVNNVTSYSVKLISEEIDREIMGNIMTFIADESFVCKTMRECIEPTWKAVIKSLLMIG
jgi:hypothetical protein